MASSARVFVLSVFFSVLPDVLRQSPESIHQFASRATIDFGVGVVKVYHSILWSLLHSFNAVTAISLREFSSVVGALSYLGALPHTVKLLR